MRVPDDHPLSVTLALRKPDTALAALEHLAGRTDPVTTAGLLDLLAAQPAAKPTLIAFERLNSPEAFRLAFRSRFAQVRLRACQRAGEEHAAELQRVLTADTSWPNRRAALVALAGWEQTRWAVLHAADDPHWRVRHALIRVLTGWERGEVFARLDALAAGSQRTLALAAYLRFAFDGTEPADWTPFTPPDRLAVCPFWDWDPAVLAVKLNAMTAGERREQIEAMPFLATHADERVWKPAVDTIREFGELRHFQAVVNELADPRSGVQMAVERLLDGLDEEKKEAISPPPPLRGRSVSAKHEPGGGSDGITHPPPGTVRVPTSPSGGEVGVIDPTTAHSWTAIEAACRVAKVPFWTVTPANPWQPGRQGEPSGVSRRLLELQPTPDGVRLAQVGPLRVSRLGISGHYLLPPEGFVRAAEAGVNWFFWEPNYATLTEFSTRLGASDRRQFHMVAGTFEADGKRIRTDVERALRMLKVEQLGLFLVFWVQSWDRMTDDLRRTVEELKAEGKVRSVGLSSHNRPLLVNAMQEGWNPVMARHSAGHRGAETGVFPFVPSGTNLITFNNLCYGRLLRPVGGLTPPTAADCYRYTLSFPQVRACWSAPATLEQLEENLVVLQEPELSAEKREEMQRFGAALYREEKVFERLVRMM